MAMVLKNMFQYPRGLFTVSVRFVQHMVIQHHRFVMTFRIGKTAVTQNIK